MAVNLTLNGSCISYELGSHPSVFKDALRDGTVNISSIPRNAAPLLGKLIEAQIFPTRHEQGSAVGLREILHKGDSRLLTGLFARLRRRSRRLSRSTKPSLQPRGKMRGARCSRSPVKNMRIRWRRCRSSRRIPTSASSA